MRWPENTGKRMRGDMLFDFSIFFLYYEGKCDNSLRNKNWTSLQVGGVSGLPQIKRKYDKGLELNENDRKVCKN